ncbi:ABC transporter substrate-binding protein [Gemmiger formicilis]|nr:ABC transporter substrate-binding protein [Gemmiger formicilis]
MAADQGSDVMQVNWNWLYQYSPTGEKFVDLREYSDVIDLSQWSDTAKNACTVADSLQAVPISMTGRIFYWNMNTFKQAGIEQVPASYDDLIAAGKAFQEKLGDDYYPLAIGQYDRMILMTFYLESKYGKAWVENNECQYSEEEIVDGLNFIDSLEDNHVIPTRPTMIAAGFDSIDKSQEWIDGKYAGIFEWDSAPPSTSLLWLTTPASPSVRRSSSATRPTAASPRSPWAWPSPSPASIPLRLLP